MHLGQLEQPGVAGLVAWHLQGGPHPAVGVQQGRGVAVAVGVDPDDGVDVALEQGIAVAPPDGDRWLAPAWSGRRPAVPAPGRPLRRLLPTPGPHSFVNGGLLGTIGLS